ncbi:MAG: hypothetical protein ABSB09_03285 [Acidimicrobiales bacterium]|jgi:nucleoside phosphorylase
MTAVPDTRHVVVLAPLPLEFDAVVTAFALRPPDDGVEAPVTGRIGGSRVSVVRLGMGMHSARAVTSGLVDRSASEHQPVDHVMVVGICGGFDPDVDVGTLVIPEVVVDLASGATFRQAPIGSEPRSGKLATTDGPLFDAGTSRRLCADGFLGVDMETSAVADVCEDRGVPWSVYRCISDRWVDGLLDQRIVDLTAADGSSDLAALGRLLASDPELAARLERLGRDATLAARRAAEAALGGCLALDQAGIH